MDEYLLQFVPKLQTEAVGATVAVAVAFGGVGVDPQIVVSLADEFPHLLHQETHLQ